MNTLSIFLYLADVLSALNLFLNIIGICGVILFAALGFDAFDRNSPWFGSGKPFFIMSGICLFLVLVAVLIPSKETLYLIAGSEIGEMAITSEPAKEILSDIQEVIQHQLDELKGE